MAPDPTSRPRGEPGIRHELEEALVQYRAGLEAELALLHQLTALPLTGPAGAAPTARAVSALADDRDRVMANIASIELDLRPMREALSAARALLAGLPGFESVMDLHTQARALVAEILAADRHALEALEDARRARQFGADDGSKGEATLAAYRRVVAPPLEGARIVDRRG